METETLTALRNSLRHGQQPLADWKGGKLAVSAVPGSGKSTGMAIGSAIALTRSHLTPKHQLIVVTFTRAAATSIKKKIKENLDKLGYPSRGFTVHTLHGLAFNIASRYSQLSGLDSETTTLVSPNQNHRLVRETVETWIKRYPHYYETLLYGVSFDGEETERLRRQSVLRRDVLPKLTRTTVQEAKSSGLSVEALWELSAESKHIYNILGMSAGLYEIYQEIARSRSLIDYDDMILGALRVLENPDIAAELQSEIYGVFEDEAQDSTPLQAKLLEILARDPHSHLPPNLVRVGDPNQAINSTFTPADPLYFRDFCNRCQEENLLAQMNQAGRSSQVIIEAANFFLHWGNQNHPRELPFRPQNIHPVPEGDPQPGANPPPTGNGLEIYTPKDIYQTVNWIGKRLQTLLEANPDHNAAILVRNNRQGSFLAQSLDYLQREGNMRVFEVSQQERSAYIPHEILQLLQFLNRPHSPEYTKAALEVLTQRNLIPKQDINALATYPEQFLYPTALDTPKSQAVQQAGYYCRSLLKATIELPTYQLISFLGLTLNYSASELATVQKLAARIRQEIPTGGSYLLQIIETLQNIIDSEQFQGIEESEDDLYIKKGQVTIITMHKAKGLDWDYVFIPFLHKDNIPGQQRVPTPSKFIGDFTLPEVARSQIRNIVHSQYRQEPINLSQPTTAWQKAGELQTAEEYRLFYVAMTRAKRLLWLAAAEEAPFNWNQFNLKGGNSLQKKDPSPFLFPLKKQFLGVNSKNA